MITFDGESILLNPLSSSSTWIATYPFPLNYKLQSSRSSSFQHEKSLLWQKPQKPQIYELQLTSSSFLTCMLWKGWTSNQRKNSQLRFSANLLSSLQNKKELQQSVLQTIRKLPFSISLINFMCMSSLACTIKLCTSIWRINSDPKKLTTKSLLPHSISHILTLEHDTPTSCFTFTSFQMSLRRSLIAVAGPLRNSAHHLS